MARLFLFAVGGTGSRVLKSLTMLLAAGVKPDTDMDFEIVPIIIDPHKSNDDLKRTVALMEKYQAITAITGTDNGFFGTRLTTLEKLSNSEHRLSSSFTLGLQQVAQTRFRDYIEFGQMSNSTAALADILFSGESINKRGETTSLLDVEMDIGFVGNPNVGSVVLNQFKDSEEFREFAGQYGKEDRIFIISSIFGGTGAAGFPTILKNVRNAINNDKINGRGNVADARVGALTVMPYFNLESSDSSPIQKSDFIAKTKAALAYYKDNVNNAVNALYYLMDDFTGKLYKNDPGDEGQQNDAHFIEMVGALAVINFMGIPDDDLVTNNGQVVNPICREFAVRADKQSLAFHDLHDDTEQLIAKRLSQFTLFGKYLREQLNGSLGKQSWSIDAPAITSKFPQETFYRSRVADFLKTYDEWLRELQANSRSFSPFSLDSSLDALIIGRKADSSLFSGKVDMHAFDSALSKTARGKTYRSAEQKFINLFFHATEELLTSKFSFKK
ncbi:MAG: hypothetical protein JWR38_5303 [Mucilaginibacter sp.]|nr:hypothetical protein [Mucilaginibacter sp.]